MRGNPLAANSAQDISFVLGAVVCFERRTVH